MFIEQLDLVNFRNISSLRLGFRNGVNVFIGDNGQGKTNLLESIYLLSKGRSFRPTTNESLIRREGLGSARVRTVIVKSGLHYEVESHLEGQRKSFSVNGKRVSSSYLVSHYPSVLFSPESLAAIKEGPEHRRLLVDEFLINFNPKNAALIADFKRCLRTRNRVLKDQKQGLLERFEAMALLESLEGSYIPLAVKLAQARIEGLRAIQTDLARAMRFISGTENVEISVDYLISGQSAVSWSVDQVYDATQKRVRDLRSSELESGSSLVGPQKHDIRFLFDGKDTRYYCSQGQQRALILSFKMAQIMYHYTAHREYPFLLLDDVLSELDPVKRSRLIEFLKGINSQIFLTTTDISCPAEFGVGQELSVFKVNQGGVEAAS